MTRWREIVLAVAGVGFLLLGYLWLQEHDARVKADITNQFLAQQRKDSESHTQQAVQEIKTERKQATTPQKQIEYVEKYVPVHLNFPVSGTDVLPNAPSATIQLPATDLPALANYVEKCNTAVAERDGCYKSLAIADKQIDSLKSTQGKGFWHKVGQCALRGGVGAAGGGMARSKNAAVGGAALGVGSCFIWKP